MREEYAETVPYREHDSLTTKYYNATKTINTLKIEHEALQESFDRIMGKARSQNPLNYQRQLVDVFIYSSLKEKHRRRIGRNKRTM